MTDLLDNLRTAEQIAERISASTGVHVTARTVWEKAKRLGIAKKIGRTMLVSIEDIPLLLKEESKEDKRQQLAEKTAPLKKKRVLAALRRARVAINKAERK